MYTKDDFTFVICAYKQSEYLEECIRSLKSQTIFVKIIFATSTPSDFLANLCAKYEIPYYVNEEGVRSGSDIAKDWNFALSKVSTSLATIAHQDDIYFPEYAEKMIQKINQCTDPIIAFSSYAELRNGKYVTDNRNLKIKKILLKPLKKHPKSIFFRRRSLSLGNAICCPAVTYVLDNLKQPIFTSGMKSNIDWDAWERLSRFKGSYCYVDEPLMAHRIHEDSTTSEVIKETGRGQEDLAMLKRFWPSWIANLIEFKYKDSEKQNDL